MDIPRRPNLIGDLNLYSKGSAIGRSTISHPADHFVGRDSRCCLVIPAEFGWVSRIHLRVYSVCVSESEGTLLYVQNLSASQVTFKSGDDLLSSHKCFNNTTLHKEQVALLEHASRVSFSGELELEFYDYSQDKNLSRALDTLQLREVKLFKRNYIISHRILGLGGFSSVRVAYNTVTGRQLACKIVDLRQSTEPETNAPTMEIDITNIFDRGHESRSRRPDRAQRFLREVEILKTLDHPNVIRIERVYISNYSLYIFQELITAGDLFSYLEYKSCTRDLIFHGTKPMQESTRPNGLEEMEAAFIIFQVLKAVSYLHDRGIAHRDLKLENILMTSLRPGARIVIADFGLASWYTDSEMVSQVGSYVFMAPEMFNKHSLFYDSPVDLWAVGIVTLLLLGAELSEFQESQTRPLEDYAAWINDLDVEVLFRDVKQRISQHAENFVRRMVVKDPIKRLSAYEALRHSWFTRKRYSLKPPGGYDFAKEFESLYQETIKTQSIHISSSASIQMLPDLRRRALQRQSPELRPMNMPTLLSNEMEVTVRPSMNTRTPKSKIKQVSVSCNKMVPRSSSLSIPVTSSNILSYNRDLPIEEADGFAASTKSNDPLEDSPENNNPSESEAPFPPTTETSMVSWRSFPDSLHPSTLLQTERFAPPPPTYCPDPCRKGTGSAKAYVPGPPGKRVYTETEREVKRPMDQSDVNAINTTNFPLGPRLCEPEASSKKRKFFDTPHKRSNKLPR